ncbi:hypothetical protein PT974_02604 [Cladobotryum mycophilum]|uniref:CBF1-interacting co-repressor CIR N-terminal domain-containing protein n=1 Tax=Cladobotryum mycophilum TaxID=491253 RepID=A0ABR0SZS3_9HYPO
MPLHLLGKKSWNVYNADNVARVRRDEANAKAAEEAEEQRMQEIDAERRLAILRGEAPPPLLEEKDEEPAKLEDRSGARPAYAGGTRKRRKRVGEDDTDYELRLAKENNDAIHGAIEASRKSTSSAPIVDHAGLIDLFGDERTRAHAEKNEEAEAEAKKKKKEYEDQYTMQFSKAAGKDGTTNPWYSQSGGAAPDSSSKNVWGKDDPHRKQRDTQRMASSDPLAMMKKGASQVRDLKKERNRIQEERDRELRQLRKERHRERHREDMDDRDHSDSRRRESRKRRPEERGQDRRDDQRERRRHKEDERRRRHHSRSRSRSPGRRSHRHRDNK